MLLGTSALCRILLPLTGLTHAGLAAWTTWNVASGAEPEALGGLMAPDPLGALFPMLTSLLFVDGLRVRSVFIYGKIE